MTFAEEREHVVFAKAENFDVLDNNHLVVSHVKQRTVQNLIGILPVTARQIPQRSIDPLWCLDQSITGGIFSQFRQDMANLIDHPRKPPNSARHFTIPRPMCY